MGILDSSKIVESRATVDVVLYKQLARSNASIGYRVFSNGKVVQRSTLRGNDISWKETEGKNVGKAEIEVPPAAVVHCFANYRGVTQVHWWVADPTTAQNPRRTIYESFDGELAVIREFLARSNARGRDARDLEVAIAWLFWMLGFSVVHLGATSRTQDAADLILATPSGNFAIVECTTGLLRTDSKLPLLIARAERVRKRLSATANSHLKIMPIIVTALTRDEIRADIEQAEKLGVLVLTREFLDQAIHQSVVLGKPDELYVQAEKTIDDGLARNRQATASSTNALDS
jgi:hypothetical protein